MAHLTDTQRENQRTHNVYGRTFRRIFMEVRGEKMPVPVLIPRHGRVRPVMPRRRPKLTKAERKAEKRLRVRARRREAAAR